MPETTETDAGRTLGQLAKDIIANPEEFTAEDTRTNAELLAEHGLKVIHFRPGFDLPGMTVAYRSFGRNSNTLEIATSITHPKDTFTKRVGTRTAIEAFVSGRTVLVPMMVPRSPTQTLKHLFM